MGKPRTKTSLRARRAFISATAALGASLLLPGSARAARVHSLKGPVSINGKPARLGTSVKPGDLVVTAAGARVAFTIGEDAFLLRENSRVALDKAAGAMIGGLRIVSGALLAVFGAGSRQLATPAATIGIRGTGVYLEADRRQTYLCACYGEVEVRDRLSKERRSILSGYHTAVMIAAGDAGGRAIDSAAVKNHTDEELIMLEALVGRTSPVKERASLRAPEGEVVHAPRPAQPATAQPAAPDPQPQPAPPAPALAAPPPAPPTRSEVLDWRLPPPRELPQR